IDEVGDAALRQAIENVSESSAQNHGHADLADVSASAFGGEKPKQKNNHGNRECKEHKADRGRMGVCKKAERYARIVRVDEVQDAWKNDMQIIGRSVFFDG